MALTTDVKTELNRVKLVTRAEMTAEVASVLRYSGALHLVAGTLVVEAELDSSATAHRLMGMVEDLYDLEAQLQVIGAGNSRRAARYVIKWVEGGLDLARRTEIIDRAGRPVRGLPRFIIGGTREQCVAAWRGAFLARGAD